MKIGDKVRVINKKSEYYNQIGKIWCKCNCYDWRIIFDNGDWDYFDTSDLQLIKPVRKWKYTRKEIAGFYRIQVKLNRSLILKDLLAKSEHTEDKSDMLKEEQDEIQEDTTSMEEKLEALDKLNNHTCYRNAGETTCESCGKEMIVIRPTLKPIENINMANYKGKRETAIEIMVENKLNELIDRINLLSIQKEKK